MSTINISDLKKDKPRQALIFTDETCPCCGEKLSIDKRLLKRMEVKIRYICYHCGFICPIKFEDGQTTPVYDQSIHDFIQNFGDKDRYKFVRRYKEEKK